jgi:hypothetical protein
MPDGIDRVEEIERKIDREVAGAVALASHPSGAVTVAPRNMAELFEFAKLMAVSGPCVRGAFRGNPGACLALAMQAFKWGADPFAVANKAYIVKNRGTGEDQIAYEAQLIHAIVNTRAPLQRRLRTSYSGEGGKRSCTVSGLLIGEDEPFEYVSPKVDEIAVKNSPLWTADRDQQLHYYSTRAWARRWCPEILLGIYTPEETRGEIIDIEARDISPPRPRPEDFAEHSSPVETEIQSFPVIDFVGEVHDEYSTEEEAIEALADWIGSAKSLKALEGIVESNGSMAAYPAIIEAYKDRKEALSNPGNRQDRPATGAPPLDPARDATTSAETGQTEHPEGAVSSTPDSGKAQEFPAAAGAATPVAAKNTTERPRDEPTSLHVPLLKEVGKPCDWKGTSKAMAARIKQLTNTEESTQNGAFVTANRANLNAMRDGDRDAWVDVMYELGKHERELRTGGPEHEQDWNDREVRLAEGREYPTDERA